MGRSGIIVSLGMLGLFTAGGIFGAVVGDYRAEAKAAEEKVEAKTITARSIRLVDEDGKCSVVIMASTSGSGIWVTDPCNRGRNVSMHWTKGVGPVFSLQDGETKPSKLGFGVTDGEAYIQVVTKDDKIHMGAAKDLIPRK